MTEKPQITTVIPTYRRPKLLRRAIQSVLKQTYPHFQVCIYDNASGDETRETVAAVARTDPRVRYHCHPENIGLVRNFAYGMEAVATPFFNFLSDDDLVFPGFFERALTAMAGHNEAILFAGATIWASPEGDINDVPIGRWREGVHLPPYGLFEVIRNGHPDFTGTLFRREVLEKVGTLDPAVGNTCDVDFFCRCAAQYPVIVATEPCGVLFQHLETASSVQPYAPDPYWPSYGTIAENVADLISVDEAQRLAARDMILKSACRNVFLRGCKAAANGHMEQAQQAAQLLRDSFSARSRAAFVRSLSMLSRVGLRCFLHGASQAARLQRMKFRRYRVPTPVRSIYARALRTLLVEVSSNGAERGW